MPAPPGPGPTPAPPASLGATPKALPHLRPCLRYAAGAPAELRWLAGEAVARNRRQHEVERVLRVSAVRCWVGEGANGLEELDDGAGPAVGHDQRQRVLVGRLDVDEVDVHAVDLGLELRQGAGLGLGPAA